MADEAGDGAPLVLFENRDDIALVTLNRPRQRNALRYESWTELSNILTDSLTGREVRAMIIAGAGGFFSAGGDLKSGPAHGTGRVLDAAGRP